MFQSLSDSGIRTENPRLSLGENFDVVEHAKMDPMQQLVRP
jgi:hypothetical protein